MSAINVATRYAKALLSEAQQQGVLDVIFQDFKLLEELTNESRDLQLLLKSPIIKSDKKWAVLDKIFKNDISELSLLFLRLVTKKKREMFLPQIITAFFDGYNDIKNIKKVDIISATPISDQSEQRILGQLKGQLGNVNIKLEKSIDPKILGGFMIKIGDKVFDTSLQSKLSALKREILEN